MARCGVEGNDNSSENDARRTGLKKWRPPKRSERFVALAMAAMERLLVLEANMQAAV
jgi:hypothetical protein